MTLHVFLVAAALIFLALTTFNAPGHPRVNYLGAGLLCWLASTLW
jgi:hypothetical protein